MATAVDGFVLPDDALVQALFEHEQLGALGFEHADDGDAGPGADDFGDFVGADFLAQEAAVASAGPVLVGGRLLLRRLRLLGQLCARVEFVEFLISVFVDRHPAIGCSLMLAPMLVEFVIDVVESAAVSGRRPGRASRLPIARAGWPAFACRSCISSWISASRSRRALRFLRPAGGRPIPAA